MKGVILQIACIILLCSAMSVNATEVIIRSGTMGKDINANIILPKQYAEQPETRYPVLYFLHGCGDSYRSLMISLPSIADIATYYNMIIVCPEAERSWYLDSPKIASSKYETYISSEVVDYIDSNYRTIADRTGRAITGNSMGGHGAAYIALRHKDDFGAFGAMSGGLDFANSSLSGNWGGWNLNALLGSWTYDSWYPYTALAQLDRPISDGDYKIVLHCGTDDFFINCNRDFTKKLESKGVTFSYTETLGGIHGWVYWNTIVEEQIKAFNEFFGNGIYETENTEYCVPPLHDYDTYALNQYVEEINVGIGRTKTNLHSQSKAGVFETLNVLPKVNVKSGSTINLEWKDSKTGTSSTAYCRLYLFLDKNQDLKFSSDEQIGVFGILNSGTNTMVANNNIDIVLPSELTKGETRIRMFYEGAFFPSPASGCASTARRVYDIPLVLTSLSGIEPNLINEGDLYMFDRNASLLTLEEEVTRVEIYSVGGAMLINSSEKTISLSNLPKGTYVVSVLKGNDRLNSVLLY